MEISDRNLLSYVEKHALLSDEQLSQAKLEIERSVKNKPSLQKVMLNLGFVTEEVLLKLIAEEQGLTWVDVDVLSPAPEIVLRIPEELARERGCLALEQKPQGLVVAMEDPNNLTLLDRLARYVTGGLLPVLASRGAILKKLAEYHDHYKISVVKNLMKGVKDGGKELTQEIGLDLPALDEVETQGRIVKAVNLLIMGALLKRASDIHLVPDSRYLRVKYRVDGILIEEQALDIMDAPAVLSRIKIMCRLNIAEKRMPQDGSFHIKIEGREIDFRVATTPTIFGEKCVMRVLDKSAMMVGLDNLGFSPGLLRGIKQLIHRPHGIILIVGPTGSGKTTSLYSALNILNTGDKNITTVEDPVEYKIEGLTQIQTHAEIGLDFAAVLRSILRQDPDVVLVGEVRDRETTEIAIRAALTGHLVFATLHTNDAAGAIARLSEMGVEPYLISSAVRGAMSQRLLRTICPHCKEEVQAKPEMIASVDPQEKRNPDEMHFFRGKGCRNCFFTGYLGRTVIAELLTVSEALRSLIVRGVSSEEINAQAIRDGMRPMFEDGVDKVLAGETTLDEILKVTEDIE